ncbi:MAG: SCO family protein [Advenella sp.]|nr:SCO family protein [Advenella sp.]
MNKSYKARKLAISMGLVFSMVFGLSACKQEVLEGVSAQSLAFIGSDITGTGFGKNVGGINQDGQAVSFNDYKDKVVVVFFGFTQCPDVCPTAMAELSQLMTKFTPEEAAQVQVVMVSIDPERDTPEMLKAYVSAFDDRFNGITGTPEQIAQLAKSFKAFYKKVAHTNGTYSMEHSSSLYVLDKNGESRILFKPGTSIEDMEKDIRSLF